MVVHRKYRNKSYNKLLEITDPQDLVCSTNNLELMRITTAGYVGINTSSTAAYLDIQTKNAGGSFLGEKYTTIGQPLGIMHYKLNATSAALTYKILCAKS